MEYTNIISLVPVGEHFDASVVGEAVWLTESHFNAIETAMGGYVSTIATNGITITTHESRISQLESEATAAVQTIAERDATIAQQATEIANLKAAAAAQVKVTTSEGDDHNDANTNVEVSDITKEAQKLRALRDGK